MTELEILKDIIAEDAHHKESLAMAIEIYLERHFPGAHDEIISIFNNIMSNRCDNAIAERLEELEGSTISR